MIKAIRYISALAAFACTAAALAVDIQPLAMPNLQLGGGQLNQYTLGVSDGVGLNNIGLLVRSWGKVTHVDQGQSFFYIDDGSGRDDKSGFVGVRVSYAGLASGVTFNPPYQDHYVTITGISSTTAILTAEGTKIIPTLRPRRQDDMSEI